MTYPQHQHPQRQPAAPKARRWPKILGIAAGALVGLVVLGAIVGPQQPAAPALSTGPRPAAEQPAEVAVASTGSVVVYEVLGSGKGGNITWMKEGFSQEQQTTAKLPWRKELQFKDQVGAFAPLSLVAQNGAKGGDITCRITVDGEIVGESTSSGQYAVVTCNGNG